MPRPKGDNPVVAPTSAPVNQGQPASVPNRARMATYNTDAPTDQPHEDIDLLARLSVVTPTTNPVTGETTQPDPVPEQPEQTTTTTPEPAPAAEQPTSDNVGALPDKYKGKSADELIRMHQEAEKRMHERDEEIRIARMYVDRFAQNPTPNQPQQQPVAAAPASLPADDVKMLELMLSKPTEFKKALLNELAGGLQQNAAQAEAQRIFNENRAVIQTEQFGRFLQTVPQFVTQQADRDPSVMNFLLSSFKATNAPAPADPVATAEKTRARVAERANAARTVPGGATGSQPTFTRTQLMKMQMFEPDKYEALQPQIMQAYANGLVGD